LHLLVGGKDRCRGRPTNSRGYRRCDTTGVCSTGRRSPTPNRSGFVGPHIFPPRITLGSEGRSGSREGEGFFDRNDDEAARTVPGRKRNGPPMPSPGDGGDRGGALLRDVRPRAGGLLRRGPARDARARRSGVGSGGHGAWAGPAGRERAGFARRHLGPFRANGAAGVGAQEGRPVRRGAG